MDYILSAVQQYFYLGLVVLGVLAIFMIVVLAGCTEVHRNYKTGKALHYGGELSDARIKIPKHGKTGKREMRGVWVATVANIDFHKHKKKTSFQKEYLEVVKNLAGNNFNTILFQIRPMNDAFYKSELNPWSRYLSGREGEGIPGFDPLAFMVRKAHARGLEFHAWLNPYRVAGSTSLRKTDYLATLDSRNFARKHPEFVLEVPLKDNRYQLILNPGEPEVIKFILATVREIVENYEVDAIHFDDYFYPYRDIGDLDRETCDKYNHAKLSLEDWRRENVNTVVKGIDNLLDSYQRDHKRKVQFGISPFGIWANKANHPHGSLSKGKQSYYAQFADTRLWVKEGWIDYIVPQLYWEFAHNAAPYAALLDWWAELARKTGVNLYIGQSAARLGSTGAWKNCNELADQLRYNSKHKTVKGTILFSYTSVFYPKNKCMRQGVKKVLAEYRRRKALNPITN